MHLKIPSTYTFVLFFFLLTQYLNLIEWDEAQPNITGLHIPL